MERKVHFETIETTDQWLVSDLLGDLERAVNSDLMKLALKLSQVMRSLRLTGHESIDVLRLRVADRLLQVCSLPERRAEVEKISAMTDELKQKLDALQNQLPKAKQQLERGDKYFKRADEQVNSYMGKMNDQRQLCKQLENKLFEVGFCTSITEPALRKLESDNERLEKQVQEAERHVKGLGLKEFTNQELRQRIDELRDELNTFDNLFDEQSEDLFPDL